MNPSDGDLFQPGDVLSGTYEIRDKIGEGGMGQVYAAWDRALQRWVAVKASRPNADASVADEARALAAVRHPSTVSVYALGVHGGIDYVVMELVRGPTLEAHLHRHHAEGSRIAIGEAIDILAGIAEGLAVVHRAGIAHRDIKPANVLLAPRNRVVLTDFGIFQPEIDVGRGLKVAGSPLYMAPESVTGRIAPGELYLVDAYSLGIVAYEMLAGRVPYDDAMATRVLLQHVREPVPDPCSVRADAPPALGKLVRELLAKDPKARPQSMDEVAWRLQQMRVARLSTPEAAVSALVVDDNPATALIVTALITAHAPDAIVLVARDGLEAMRIVGSTALPDLLVVDLHLPGMGGVELTERIGATHAFERSVVVCTSAQATADELQRLRELPFVRFVAKGDPLIRRLPAYVRAAQERAKRRQARPFHLVARQHASHR
jgi:serine/threonine-protein kinase